MPLALISRTRTVFVCFTFLPHVSDAHLQLLQLQCRIIRIVQIITYETRRHGMKRQINTFDLSALDGRMEPHYRNFFFLFLVPVPAFNVLAEVFIYVFRI